MNKPFFAQFLEEQEIAQVSGGAVPDLKPVTKKNEDQVEVTLKYPSDGDEGAEI